MNSRVEVIVKNDGAQLPTYGSDQAGGADIYCPETIILQPHETRKINVRISLSMPAEPPMVGKLFDRSSMASKGLRVLAGVIDQDYQGELIIVMENTSDTVIALSQGERIAQLVFMLIVRPTFVEVPTFTRPPTERGEKGFGSTGK
jgi:dUTP pyrophosphatase